MSELPKGWTSTSLGAAAALSARRVPSFFGSRPYLATADVNGGLAIPSGEFTYAGRPARADLLLKMGDVIQAKMKATHKALLVGSAQDGWLASTGFAQFTPADAGNSPAFFLHVISSRSFLEEKDARCVGSTQQAISDSSLASISVLLPPEPEQFKIAQILDTLGNVIAQTETIISKLEAVKQGLLHDLLTRGIDANGELRPPQSEAPQLYKQSALGWIPNEWNVSPAEDVCIAVVDCKNRTPPVLDAGHPVVRTSNVRDGKFVYDELVYTDSVSYRTWTQRGKPRPGDVLITREAPVGEVCLVPDEMNDACLGQRMMMYQPDSRFMRNDFMLAALMSRPVRKKLLDLAGGSTVGHVRVGDIRSLPLPLPPLSEQSHIARSYQALGKRLNAEEEMLQKLRSQKSGLMDDLLTGRIRVTPLLETAAG